MTDYNKLYETTPNALGAPDPWIIQQFEGIPRNARVVDIGAGQGRDALALVDMGFSVHMTDVSPNGLQQAHLACPSHRLTSEVLGFETPPRGTFEVILFDRVLHMSKNAVDIFAQYLKLPATNMIIVSDEKKNITAFAECAHATDSWSVRTHRGTRAVFSRKK